MLNIIQVPNTSIGKQMSLNQEFFFYTPSHEIVSLSGKEVRYIFDYKKYKKRLGGPARRHRNRGPVSMQSRAAFSQAG